MRVKPIAFGILTIALFAGTVGVAMAAGSWQTTGRSADGAGAGSGTGSGPGTGVPATIADVTQIKGWMPIGDVATATGVDLAVILAAFDLPADTPPTTAVKDLESDTFSVANLRTWLTERGAAGGAGAPAPDGSVSP
jgi:hypothetical protein